MLGSALTTTQLNGVVMKISPDSFDKLKKEISKPAMPTLALIKLMRRKKHK